MKRALLWVTLLTTLCSALLWATHAGTAQRINAARAQALHDSLTALAGAEQLRSAPDLQVWPLQLCGGLTLFRAPGRGYGGAMELLVALQHQQPEPLIANVRVQRHRETPGIGDFIAAGAVTTAAEPDPWLQRFIGHSASSLAARAFALDAVSGATVTVKAVRKALRLALSTATTAGANPTATPFSLLPCGPGSKQ